MGKPRRRKSSPQARVSAIPLQAASIQAQAHLGGALFQAESAAWSTRYQTRGSIIVASIAAAGVILAALLSVFAAPKSGGTQANASLVVSFGNSAATTQQLTGRSSKGAFIYDYNYRGDAGDGGGSAGGDAGGDAGGGPKTAASPDTPYGHSYSTKKPNRPRKPISGGTLGQDPGTGIYTSDPNGSAASTGWDRTSGGNEGHRLVDFSPASYAAYEDLASGSPSFPRTQ
jgi:hypothetical protein